MPIPTRALTAAAVTIVAGAGAAPADAETTATCRVEARMALTDRGLVAQRVGGVCAGRFGRRVIPSATFALRHVRGEVVGGCEVPRRGTLEVRTLPMISFSPRPEGERTSLDLATSRLGVVEGRGTTADDAFATTGVATWNPGAACAGTWALELVMAHTGPRPASGPAPAAQPARSGRPKRKRARRRSDARERPGARRHPHRKGRRHA